MSADNCVMAKAGGWPDYRGVNKKAVAKVLYDREELSRFRDMEEKPSVDQYLCLREFNCSSDYIRLGRTRWDGSLLSRFRRSLRILANEGPVPRIEEIVELRSQS
ncbi:hypothetical protein NDU88_004296 [Pleurodeles waltl]|uniref:Uncharacterized protein n=1 Tax=Pleurodeles waltl TaxID=8319 RepID=A0AAV7W9Y6_PLEWA|nr:hypothetical protein NDU88_004296 [Pleurodeles waltl]